MAAKKKLKKAKKTPGKPAKKAARKVVRTSAGKKPARKSAAAARRAPVAAVAAPAKTPRREPEGLRLRSVAPGLTVSDLQKSLAFYEGCLGFYVSERWTDGDVLRGVMMKAGAIEFGLSQDDWKLGRDRQKGAGFRLWCQTVQSVDELAKRLKAAGYALTEEPQDHPEWRMRSFSVDDPDGFHLTIAQNL